MKLSELIYESEEIIREHGDLDVFKYQNSSPMLPSESLFTKRDFTVQPPKRRRYSNDPENLPKRVVIT